MAITIHNKIENHLDVKSLSIKLRKLNSDCVVWIEGDYLCAGYAKDHEKFKLPTKHLPLFNEGSE